MRKTVLLFSFLLGVSIFSVNQIALQSNLYLTVPWLDVPLHFFGGMFVAFAIVGFLQRRIAHRGVRVVALVLVVGILWELFEYCIVYHALGGPRPGSGMDLMADLFFDVLGGILAWYFVSLLQKKYNTQIT